MDAMCRPLLRDIRHNLDGFLPVQRTDFYHIFRYPLDLEYAWRGGSHIQTHDVTRLEQTQLMDAEPNRSKQGSDVETDSRHGLRDLGRPPLIRLLPMPGNPSPQ